MSASWEQYFLNREPGLDDAELDLLEKAVGVLLPRSLRELYATLSYGRFRFPLFIDEAETYYSLGSLIEATLIELDEAGFIRFFRDLVQDRKLVPAHLIPFALEDGGNVYCIDRRDESVWYADMELGMSGVLPAPVRLTNTLDEFLRRGQNDPEDEDEAP